MIIIVVHWKTAVTLMSTIINIARKNWHESLEYIIRVLDIPRNRVPSFLLICFSMYAPQRHVIWRARVYTHRILNTSYKTYYVYNTTHELKILNTRRYRSIMFLIIILSCAQSAAARHIIILCIRWKYIFQMSLIHRNSIHLLKLNTTNDFLNNSKILLSFYKTETY